MKKAKKFFIYFMFFLLVPIVCAGIFFAVLYFFPDATVLGYKYVKFEETTVASFSQTDLSGENVKSIKVLGGNASIVVEPNTESDDIILVYQQKISGFSKTNNKEAALRTEYVDAQYEEHLGNYRSLTGTVVEPSGLLVASSSIVHIILPSSYNVQILYCKSTKDIRYSSSTTKKENGVDINYETNVDDVYFASQGTGAIILNCSGGSKFNLTTEKGNVELAGENFSAEKIKFDTKTGQLKSSVSDSATLTLTDKLEVVSYDEKGAKIDLDVLNGNLVVSSTGGSYKINTIGSESNQSCVILNSTNSSFEFGVVYGFVSLQNCGDNRANIFSAKTINNEGAQLNAFEVGKGSINIEKLKGNSKFSSSTGKIFVGEINKESSIYAFSDSGEINLTYEYSTTPMKGTDVVVFSSTGDVCLDNISGLLRVNILTASKTAKLDIVITSVCNDNLGTADNVVQAKDRDVTLTLKDFSDNFAFRFLTAVEPVFQENLKAAKYPPTRVNSGDEYLLNQDAYKGYSYQWRLNYGDTSDGASAVYNTYAKLLVSTTGAIKMFARPI